jgi:malate synthase
MSHPIVDPFLTPTGVRIVGPLAPGDDEILTPAAMDFLAALVRRFGPEIDKALRRRRREFYARRITRQPLSFLSDTEHVRTGDWMVAPAPADLRKRLVEITGPVHRKMIINALNSGADCFMADFEDSTSPTWDNMVRGQVHLRDAVRRTISHYDHLKRKKYELNPDIATLLVRPRGLHMVETHFLVDDRPAPASLFDFGLYFFNNARALLKRGTAPYFYLPKLESHLEARLWNDIFVFAQDQIDMEQGTIRATVLIETLPAAFEMDEILYELRDHSAGLNCGRWDYMFSFIKIHRDHAWAMLPDRAQITMTQPFMRAYTQLVVKTCHRRGAHAIGGMAAQIPVKDDLGSHREALDKVHADKQREVEDGHDGTWVAHPGLVAAAREVFEAGFDGDNQLHIMRDDFEVTEQDLLALPTGTRTEDGLRLNVRVGIQYLEAWLSGNGCVPLYNLMEDAATAEISRAQLWQWLKHGAVLEDGRAVNTDLLDRIILEELKILRHDLSFEVFDRRRFEEATELFRDLCVAEEMDEFLTLVAQTGLTQPLTLTDTHRTYPGDPS